MNIIKPQRLKMGDTIGILATSGPIEKDSKVIINAVKFLELCGFNVLVSSDVYKEDRYLAGDDETRLKNLHEFFENDQIKAIVCLRGGYGAIRLINRIDYELIRRNPKIFCGYSDVTALSLMFLKRAGLITYSGPMIASDFGRDDLCEFTMDEFFRGVCNEKQVIPADHIIIPGTAKGIMWGGNLSTIVSLCGQDFIPDEPFIFFAEDINEPAYKIDKMLTQLMNIEKFRKNVRALCFGEFLQTDNPELLLYLFAEMGNELGVPTLDGFRFSHSKDKTTVAIGAEARLIEKTLYIE